MNDKRLYLAYGSSMNVDQMTRRCPTASIVGKSYIEGYNLVFRRHATIEPCEGSRVPAVVWELTQKDEASLDRYEGVSGGYYRKEFMEVDLGGRPAAALVYVMCGGPPLCAPASSYFDIILAGYESSGFDTEALRQAAMSSS